MKKLLLPVSLCIVAIFALSFFTLPDVNKFISNQMAAVIGIDINKVIKWQSQRGLHTDLSIGDSGKDIFLLQYAMNKALLDFRSKNIDGHFGPKTLKAVKDFQISLGLNESGEFDTGTRLALNNLYFKELCPDGQGNIFPDQIMIHLNKNISLPDDYIPNDLINITDRVKTINIACLKQEVAPFLTKMFDDAESENISLAVTSAFRRPEVQSVLYKALLLVKGEKAKDRVAKPLHSEHQLGTTVDITGKSISYASTSDKFDETTEYKWLKQHAYKYGFVLSYPKDKRSTTGYDYEPWHYRYVGLEIAKEIFDKQISVEEYFSNLNL